MSHQKPIASLSVSRLALDFLPKILSALALSALLVAGLELARILSGGDGPFAAELELLEFRPMAITVVLGALALLALRASFNRLSVALLSLATFAALLLIAHRMKETTLGKPLVPADLGQLHELWDVRETLVAGQELEFIAIGLMVLAALVAIAVCLIRKATFPMRLGERAMALALAALLIGSELQFAWFIPALEGLGIENNVWSYGYNLRVNGFGLPLAMNARQVLRKPKGYGQERLDRLFEGLPEEARAALAPAEKPDVVVYMAEAFWDVTKLPVQFSRDPLPNFRALAASHTLLPMTSPQRGGGTANVEFEALTGISHGVLPVASVPYQHYVHRPLRALPTLFREQGYEARAINNFHRYYFSASSVYPLFGFERFIALDEIEPLDLEGRRPEGFVNNKGLRDVSGTLALVDGHFPSDEPLVRRILQELDAGDVAKPKFIFALGMVGHGPFLYEPWPDPDVTVEAREGQPPLTEEAARDLENVANAVFRADKALGFLVRALEKRARPTLLVFFGDHLPSLREHTFASVGFDAGELGRRRYETAALFWSNQPLPKIEAKPAFSVFYLSAKILRAARLPLPKHLRIVSTFESKMPSLNASLLQSGDGRWLAGPSAVDASSTEGAIIEALSLLAYDRLMGERLSERE